MWESDEHSIRYLQKAYSTDLPTQIENALDEVEKNRLIAQRHKISHLLEHGYGVTVSPHTSEDYRHSGSLKQTSQISPSEHEDVIPTSAFLATQERQVAVQSKTSKRRVPFRDPDPEEAPRHPAIRDRKRVAKSENLAAVAKLRKEFADITKRLASGLSHDETRSLTTRRANIRMLLERGYRVLLNRDE